MSSPVYILGINSNIHQSAAVLIKDGVLVAGAEEERFTRVKYDKRFPESAIEYCLKTAGITLADVQYAGFYWQPWKGLLKRVWWLFRYFPRSLQMLSGAKEGRGSLEVLCEHFSIPFKLRKRGFKGTFHFVDHHMAHAASAFFVSPYERAAIFTTDFCGEDCTTMLAVGTGNTIRPLARSFLPHSLGLFYAALTQFLGYKINADEYRVMGLAPYGTKKYTSIFSSMVKFVQGKIVVDNSWFDYHLGGERVYSKKWIQALGVPCSDENSVESGEYKHHAASGQGVLDSVFVDIGTWLQKHTQEKNLCMAGGVALNSVSNGKLKRAGVFGNIWVQPASYDPGCALGVCFYIWHHTLQKPRSFVMEHAYWGPEYSHEQMKAAAEAHGLEVRTCEDIEKVTATFLSEGKVVGWYQGRMEWGPRALGNRSILADPRREEMKEVVNRKIKFREPYRPFAPAVLEEDTAVYFDIEGTSPYMTMVCPVKKEKQNAIPAVTHIDGSARIQTVSKATNPRFWKLINAFKEITGESVVMNTSFNVKGEPIVCTPEEAVRCFLNTEMDYLILGTLLCSRKQKTI